MNNTDKYHRLVELNQFTKSDMVELLGLSPRSIERYKRGTQSVPKNVLNTLAYHLKYGEIDVDAVIAEHSTEG